MTFWVLQLLNGLSFGMLLFLLAAGLSLIFGLMRILNLAHGSYYLLGAYVALAVVQGPGNLPLAIVAGVAVVVALGVVMERVLLRRLPPHEELPQALLTFGFLLIVGDIALWTWGGTPQSLPKPDALSASVRLGPLVFPIVPAVSDHRGHGDRGRPLVPPGDGRSSEPWCAPPSMTRRSPGPPASTSRF